ncbi:hypothetical protein M378DRAFT_375127 [Amanita muscaria Koide BX008]|uniref:Polymerase beta nucleotidyltransferase domain-containing protein n=1 Tax=Amanita muscaria (strain Koide BX008) TaxID=946122 RepID=A0A0C2TIA4_AMAMK|nr:hypothetical protein M378DRAFT_375127 [Amanita muscaria Koide BX008]
MATFLSEPVEVPPAVLSQSDILSTASSIIQTYPSVTSAYLYGSYAKGTAHPDSDIDIVIFMPDRGRGKPEDIGGVLMDLESALHRRVDLDVSPPDDFLKWIRRYWIPINLQHCCNPGAQNLTDSSSGTISSLSDSDEIKERLRDMELVCKDLINFIDHVNSISKLDHMHDSAISNCVNRLGYSIKSRELGFDEELQKAWTSLRAVTADHCHTKHDLSKVWNDLTMALKNLRATIETRLKEPEQTTISWLFSILLFLFQLINTTNLLKCFTSVQDDVVRPALASSRMSCYKERPITNVRSI